MREGISILPLKGRTFYLRRCKKGVSRMSASMDDVLQGDASLMLDESTLGMSSSSLLLDQSEMSMSEESSSRSLRSSRRRIQKHSAVVLSSDRLRKVQNSSSSNAQSDDLSAVAAPVRDSSALATVIEDASDCQTSPTSQQPPSQQSLIAIARAQSQGTAALRIALWWQRARRLRLNRFTLSSRWTITQALKVFAVLLGHRVRRLLRSPEAIKLIAAQQDMCRVLVELINQQLLTHSDVLALQQTALRNCWLPEVKALLSSRRFFASADSLLAQSLVKELQRQREKLTAFVFADCHWRTFPCGFWLLRPCVLLNVASGGGATAGAQSRMSFSSPPRANIDRAIGSSGGGGALSVVGAFPLTSAHQVQETPPHIKRVIERSQPSDSSSSASALVRKVPVRLNLGRNALPIVHDEDLHVREQQPYTHDPSLKNEDPARQSIGESSFQLEGAFAAIPLDASTTNRGVGVYQDERPITPSAVYGNAPTATATAISRPTVRRIESTSMASSLQAKVLSHNQRASTPSSSVFGNNNHNNNSTAAHGNDIGTRTRLNPQAHIQLDIISGERLIPARKGAMANKESTIADRKPGLKVTLSLPTTTSAVLKKAVHLVKDWDELTLNPQWDARFELSLPIPKAILKAFAEEEDSRMTLSRDDELSISESDYQSLCKQLLNYWSAGQILIEVCDNERFNEEIFMGQVVLLMTAFLPMIKRVDELEIKGNFVLEKAKPTNRVSGSVRLVAYLHVPEREVIEELLKPFVLAYRNSGAMAANMKLQLLSLRPQLVSSTVNASSSAAIDSSFSAPPSSASVVTTTSINTSAAVKATVNAVAAAVSSVNAVALSMNSQKRALSRPRSSSTARPLSRVGDESFVSAEPLQSDVSDGHSRSPVVKEAEKPHGRPTYMSKFMQSLATSLEEIDTMLSSSQVDSKRLQRTLLDQVASDSPTKSNASNTRTQSPQRLVKDSFANDGQEESVVRNKSSLPNWRAVDPIDGIDDLLAAPTLEYSENIHWPSTIAAKLSTPPPPPPPPLPLPHSSTSASTSESRSLSKSRAGPRSADRSARNGSPVAMVARERTLQGSAARRTPVTPAATTSSAAQSASVSPNPFAFVESMSEQDHGVLASPLISRVVSQQPSEAETHSTPLSEGARREPVAVGSGGGDRTSLSPSHEDLVTPIRSSRLPRPHSGPHADLDTPTDRESAAQQRASKLLDMQRQLSALSELQHGNAQTVDDWSRRLAARRKDSLPGDVPLTSSSTSSSPQPEIATHSPMGHSTPSGVSDRSSRIPVPVSHHLHNSHSSTPAAAHIRSTSRSARKDTSTPDAAHAALHAESVLQVVRQEVSAVANRVKDISSNWQLSRADDDGERESNVDRLIAMDFDSKVVNSVNQSPQAPPPPPPPPLPPQSQSTRALNQRSVPPPPPPPPRLVPVESSTAAVPESRNLATKYEDEDSPMLAESDEDAVVVDLSDLHSHSAEYDSDDWADDDDRIAMRAHDERDDNDGRDDSDDSDELVVVSARELRERQSPNKQSLQWRAPSPVNAPSHVLEHQNQDEDEEDDGLEDVVVPISVRRERESPQRLVSLRSSPARSTRIPLPMPVPALEENNDLRHHSRLVEDETSFDQRPYDAATSTRRRSHGVRQTNSAVSRAIIELGDLDLL